MSTHYPPSELIVNPDGSIYHLNLRPEDIGDFIITVGDQNRVPMVSKHFDRLEVKREKREFVTHTGYLGDRRISVISTGIGPDNIDIVINEIDALVNIDLEQREDFREHRMLTFMRMGTTGGLSKVTPVDSIICSAFGLGFDNLLNFYDWEPNAAEQQMTADWHTFVSDHQYDLPITPYSVQGSVDLLAHMSKGYHQGITITAPGFYAPQGRQLRAKSRLSPAVMDALRTFRSSDCAITNLEMETSAIYGLCRILGHKALSCNVVLANREANTFSSAPKAAVENLIVKMLERIVTLP
ncbi:MAG: nucleoside phosphorylase [Bacteroidota bacterium]